VGPVAAAEGHDLAPFDPDLIGHGPKLLQRAWHVHRDVRPALAPQPVERRRVGDESSGCGIGEDVEPHQGGRL